MHVLARRSLGALLLVLASHGGLSAQTTAGAEQRVRAYFDAVRSSDFGAAAGMMHGSALAEIRSLVDLMVATDPAIANALLNLNATDYGNTSDVEVFAGFMQFVMTQDPMMSQTMGSMDMQVIGPVAEGDTLHVVTRVGLEVQGLPIRQLQVTSVTRDGAEWRVLLTGEIEGLVAVMRQQLNAM